MKSTEAPTCSVCGIVMHKAKHIAKVPCCLHCRRSLPREEKLMLGVVKPRRKGRRDRCYVYFGVCQQCEQPFASRTKDSRFCSRKCVGASQRVRPDSDPRVRRQLRALEAVGLTEHHRRKLLAKWKRQGRSCAYCAGACDTVDHVMPLVRGGTNYEGNLVPCCKACNSSKAARLLVEWRTGLPAAKSFAVAPLRAVRKRERGRNLTMNVQCVCDICGSMFVGRRRHCSDECMLEHNRRVSRDRHRIKHGLPGVGEPSSKWRQGGKVRAKRRRRNHIVAPIGQLELIA